MNINNWFKKLFKKKIDFYITCSIPVNHISFDGFMILKEIGAKIIYNPNSNQYFIDKSYINEFYKHNFMKRMKIEIFKYQY